MLALYLELLTMLRLHDAPLGSIIKTFRCCSEKDCFLILSEKWHNSISPFQFTLNMEKECSVLYVIEERQLLSKFHRLLSRCISLLLEKGSAQNMQC